MPSEVCSRCGTPDSDRWYFSATNCLCVVCAQADGIDTELDDVDISGCWICGDPTNEAEDLCGPCAAQRADTLRLVEELEAEGYGVKR